MAATADHGDRAAAVSGRGPGLAIVPPSSNAQKASIEALKSANEPLGAVGTKSGINLIYFG
jgi:hypothetical protein